MSISSTDRKAGPYACNGAQVVFDFAFKVFEASDLRVVKTDSSAVETDLALTTHYTVSLNADQDTSPGGTITTVATYATGNKITITSEVPETQGVSLTNLGGFYPAVINKALDRLTILVQQLAEKVARAPKVDISSTDTPEQLLTDIFTAETNSAASAAAAATSESAAATSATNAATSASAAATSATAAASSASAASTSATAASGSASAAATSETNAANSASAAATSASNAATSATNASNSATSAAGYLAPVTATSASSVLIGTGSKSFTIETGKAFVAGHPIRISDTAAPSTNYMTGTVTSYNSGTGALVVDVTATAGSGTLTAWTIALVASTTDASKLPLAGGTMSGDIGMGNNDVTGVKTVGFNGEVDNGNSGTAATITLASGQKQKITLTGNATLTISFTGAPVGQYQLRLIQDGTGSRTVTWSGLSASRWLGAASAPAINSAVAGETIVSIYYDGTNAVQSAAKVGAA